MAVWRVFLEPLPLLSMFLVIALGYAFGALSFRGVSLGMGAVRFVGLVAGVVAPHSAPPAVLGSLGRVMRG